MVELVPCVLEDASNVLSKVNYPPKVEDKKASPLCNPGGFPYRVTEGIHQRRVLHHYYNNHEHPLLRKTVERYAESFKSFWGWLHLN
ncbi:hypothetical protein FRX31_011321 [Thalictrum thalictroides]|uniref:Uncharacterized protein n=1 Tax=Thalictrum thalictroides TaxID=46969 RepID=A0A7J6WNY0_THATH|nr:hypothetical protein FRX31_011321 [Thalictrum thalictroides]